MSDHVVGIPRAAGAVVDRGERPRSAAAEIESLQRTVCEEADRAAVGRPERKQAPSVPASGFAVAVASDRSQSCGPFGPDAANTIWRPSGESANDVGSAVAESGIARLRRTGAA
jgi:hypothetical protein